jgi:hypothetical protein
VAARIREEGFLRAWAVVGGLFELGEVFPIVPKTDPGSEESC